MSDRITWIVKDRVSILFEDYSGLKGDELLEVLFEAAEVLQNLNEQVPVLLNFSNTTVNKKFVLEIGRLGKELNAKHRIIAVYGVSSIQQVLAEMAVELSGTLSKISFFDNQETAINFLIH